MTYVGCRSIRTIERQKKILNQARANIEELKYSNTKLNVQFEGIFLFQQK
jgi:protein-L-isoaspartate O-methyltransferase